MAEVTKKNLVLGFSTAAGKEVKLTIKEPADGLEAAKITAVMDEIITVGALGGSDKVTAKENAKYVIQEVEEIALV